MSGIKTAITICIISIALASYYALASYSANYAAATTIMKNAETVQRNWVALTSSIGLDPSQTNSKQLSPILIRNHSGLEWLIYGEHVMQDKYKDEFRSIKLHPIMESIHVTANGSELHYGVGGSRLNQFSVAPDGSMSVFYSEIYRPVLETLIELYDNKPFDPAGSNTGVVRYGKLENQEYAVGIYFEPASLTNVDPESLTQITAP